MTRVHSIWSKDNLVRILTVSKHDGERDISVERYYADWERDITKHTMFLSWQAEQDNQWLDQLVRLIKVTRGRSNRRQFQSWLLTEDDIISFCELADKAGFTCHKYITLRGEPIGAPTDIGG